ncbi:MAG TPA: alpha-amylase family glycosyl hydrolase, partial [Chitinophagaceae bacterium]|nr:alpha-amylase family glycosyl hydrolase [Chitinophagaceae bacterium]
EGNFAAFEKELPRLKDMGVETLWLMPITPISHERRLGSLGSYYACSDYTAVNSEYGTIEDFKQLVQSAHASGLKVIIDWVANHTGWDHRWTKAHPGFYRRNLDGQFFDQHGWADVIDLNYDNEELWHVMLHAMRFWIKECDIDGFRCDMAMLVPLEFWKYARTELDKIKPLFWLAECEEIYYHEVFDVTYTWKFLHKMEAYCKKETGIAGLDEVLHYYNDMFPPGALRAYFTTNHDENSHSGSEYERLGQAAKAFAVFCCTWNGIPLIYSGQELPLTRRLKFFDKDPIEWNGKYKLHNFYKTLLTLRKTNPALKAGDAEAAPVRLLNNASHFVFVFFRKKGSNRLLVLLNLSNENKPLVHLGDPTAYGEYRNIFTGSAMRVDENTYFSLAPWEYLVLSL